MPYRMLSLALCSLMLFASIGVPPSAKAATFQLSAVEGRVYGPDAKPIDRAIIRVFDEGGFREAGRTQTDSSGKFSLSMPPGRYIVEADPVTAPTLAKMRQEVEILQGPGLSGAQRVNIGFKLKLAATAVTPTGPHFDQQVPGQAKADYDRGVQLLGTDREQALEALRKALQTFPEYYDALEQLGTEYIKDNHLDHALVILMKAIEVNPKGERSHYGLGVVYYKKARFDLAIQAFNRALETSPNNPSSLLYLGLSQLRAGNAKDAEPTLKRAYEQGAKTIPDLHLALTKIYGDSNRNREAANQLKTMLKEIPDYKDAEKIREIIKRYESK